MAPNMKIFKREAEQDLEDQIETSTLANLEPKIFNHKHKHHTTASTEPDMEGENIYF